ncbi:MAG: hypothetical protein NZ519_09790 [Bacteroidia bacterium]|nr:hypothetical protein [Bacteroidia bacterium]
MEKAIFILSVFIFFVLAGCSNKETKQRREVSIAYANAMAQQDYETAKKYCTEESKKKIDYIKGVGIEQQTKVTRSKYIFVSETVYDNKATIKLKDAANQNQEVEIFLKKQNGKWLVTIENQENFMK